MTKPVVPLESPSGVESLPELESPPAVATDNDDNESPLAPCDVHGCRAPASYPAPKSRQLLNEKNGYYKFCREHARQYNKKWNYYHGMNSRQIEADRQFDQIGRRHLFDVSQQPERTQNHTQNHAHNHNPQSSFFPHTKETQGACQTLQLEPPLTAESLRAKYKYWVKALHPDVNGRNRHNEKRLQDINAAYATLKKHLMPEEDSVDTEAENNSKHQE